MASVYGFVKAAYKTVLPKPVRYLVYSNMPFKWRQRLIQRLEASAQHDEIYDADYYRLIEPLMAESADVIAQSIVAEFAPRSIIDVGCGTGLLLLRLKERGCRVIGLEKSKAAIDICIKRNIPIKPFDLERDEPLDLRANLVVSTEVAEHLPETVADSYVQLLCDIADRVIFTAAPPSRGGAGADHVNEQPIEYWIEKFVSLGFRYHREISLEWRERWRSEGVNGCYVDSLMIFTRSP
jgi:SAM-dependent methyltransferase